MSTRSTTFRTAFGVLLALFLGSVPALAQAPPADAINLSQVAVYNSPADIASWPVTTAITRVDTQRPDGLSFTFSARNTWPDYVPPGWDGGLQYTVWAVVQVNGQWYTSGFIQMWRDRASTGAPLLTDFARNWVYDSRWGPMMGHQPVVGEQMGFFVSSGNARGVTSATSVRERSNVVVISVPPNDTGSFTFPQFGSTFTPPVVRSFASDFDSDGKVDVAVFASANAAWSILNSRTQTVSNYAWGAVGDIPVPDDYDGDGTTDLAVFRPSTGTWYIRNSRTVSLSSYGWGAAGDIPVPGDYDGDGKTDIAIFRPSTSTWYIVNPFTGARITCTWGASGDIPVPGDYDGDGKIDVAVFRPSTGAWYIRNSSTVTLTSYSWGASADVPVPNDYDGDGKSDIGVFRPSTGTWYLLKSSTGGPITYTWGT